MEGVDASLVFGGMWIQVHGMQKRGYERCFWSPDRMIPIVC
jgi:hypothetical protein